MRRERRGLWSVADREPAEACNFKRSSDPIVKEQHMASQQIPYPADYDLEAELADQRYHRALRQVTVFDVVSLACAILSEREMDRTHPLYHLARHVLQHGSYKRSGRYAHMSDSLSRTLEDVCDEAVERCVVDILQSDQEADMALDME
jgi:hypothetical protein